MLLKRFRATLLAGAFAFVALAGALPAAAGASAFPGTNGKGVYSEIPSGSSTAQLWTVNPDGTSPTQITNPSAAFGGDMYPRFSADGKKLVWLRQTTVNPAGNQVWTANADGTGASQVSITGLPAGDTVILPTFSADGTEIAFEDDHAGVPAGIWEVPVAGGAATQLTSGNDSQPTFSPDGTKLAFFRAFTLELANADGSSPQAIFTTTNLADSPDFSPDGKSIVFQMKTPSSGNFDIYKVSTAPGSTPTNLTNATGSVSDTNPAYSPDGTKIAFLSSAGGVEVMSSSGGTAISVVNPSGASFHGVDWQPIHNTSGDPLTWGSPTPVTGEQNGIYGLSCPTAALCLTSDGGGDVFNTKPTSGGWTKATIDTSSTNFLYGLACASATLCVAGDNGGAVFDSTNPTGPASAWHKTTVSSYAINALACDTGPLCLASVNDPGGRLYVSANPTAASPTWTHITGVTIDNNNPQTALACARGSTTDRCFGVDFKGNVTWSTSPTSTQWFSANIDGSNWLNSISCPSINLCVADDVQGNLVTSVQPTGGASQWHVTQIVSSPDELGGVSCAADSNGNLCVATDINGDTFDFSVSSTGAVTGLHENAHVDSTSLLHVSCATTSLCAASDNSPTGHVVFGSAGGSTGSQKPTVFTGDSFGQTVTNLNPQGATLHGQVNPNGSTVTDCHFDYWTGSGAHQQVPCSTSPGGGTSLVDVSATITGLVPGTTYSWDVSATNAKGTTTTPAPASEAFTTPSEKPDVFNDGVVDSITTTSAKVHGQVNPNGANVTDCHFDYWTGSGTHQQAPCSPAAPFGGDTPVDVDATLTGLAPGTTYSWDLSATNANGTVTSASPSPFTTNPPPPPVAPQVSTDLPTGADEHTINLSGLVNPEASQTDWAFQYSPYPDLAYAGQTATDSGTGPLNGSSSQIVGAAISSYGGNGFNPNTTMYYRLVGTNAGGTTYGNILKATTTPASLGITVHYLDANFNLKDFAASPPSSPFDAGSEEPMDWGCSVDGLPSAQGVQHCQISVSDDQGNSYQIALWTNDDATGVDSAQADLPTNCSGSSTCHFKVAVSAQDLYGDNKSVSYSYAVNPPTVPPASDTAATAANTAGSLNGLLAGGLAPFGAKYAFSDKSGNILGWYMNDGSVIAAGSGNLISDNGAGWKLRGPDGHVIAAGSGNVIAAGSGNVIAAGSGNVIAAGSGNVIAAGSGNVIGAGSGNIIGAGGANIIGAGGANVIAAGSGNVIAAGSGNIIGAGGANIIGAGGANLLGSLARASATSAAPVTLFTGSVRKLRHIWMLANNVDSYGIGTLTAKITLRIGHQRAVTLALGRIAFVHRRQVRTMMLFLIEKGVRLLANVTHQNVVRRRQHRHLLKVTLSVKDVFVPKLKGKQVVVTRRVTVAPGSRLRHRKR